MHGHGSGIVMREGNSSAHVTVVSATLPDSVGGAEMEMYCVVESRFFALGMKETRW